MYSRLGSVKKKSKFRKVLGIEDFFLFFEGFICVNLVELCFIRMYFIEVINYLCENMFYSITELDVAMKSVFLFYF